MFFKYTNRKYAFAYFRRKKKLKQLLDFFQNKKKIAKQGIQLEDESLYFSEIEPKQTAVSAIQPPEEKNLIPEQKQENVKPKILQAEISNNPQPQTDVVKPKRELPKSSSLGNMLKEVHQNVDLKKEENIKEELSVASLPILWKNFLQENEEKLQNAFLSVAQNQQPQLIEDRITFTETNNISLELLQLHKIDIVSYFIKKTTTSFVQLDFKLNKKEDTSKSYKTTKDRLKEMIEQNENVLELIKKLDLNLD